MQTISQLELTPPSDHRQVYDCPVHCDLPRMIDCLSRHVQELRADLIAARGYTDEEIVRSDLRTAEDRLARLMAIVRSERRAA